MSDMEHARYLSPEELLRQFDSHNQILWENGGLYMSHSNPGSIPISSYSSLLSEVNQKETRWQRMSCKPYENGRKADASDIGFLCKNGSLVLLSDASEGKVEISVQGKLPNDIAAKLMIRIEFEHCHIRYERQIMSRRSTRHAEPISMEELARKVAQEMGKFLDKAHEEIGGLTYRGASVKLENLALIRLRRVTSGSWVPDFALRLD